jgi:PhnB protein
MKRVLIVNGRALVYLIIIGISTSGFWQKNNEPRNDTIENRSNNKKKIQMSTLTTYLFFNGNCRQAMEFYKSCFGGDLTQTSLGQSPMKDIFPESMHDKTINARLTSENFDITASDWLRPGQTPVRGNMVCLYLSGGNPRQLKALFDKLSQDGDVTDPLKIEIFGTYGALNDKFGVRWMFHTDQKD